MISNIEETTMVDLPTEGLTLQHPCLAVCEQFAIGCCLCGVKGQNWRDVLCLVQVL